MKFEATAILSQLPHVSECHSLVVAYSGGLDSTVLLHALADLRSRGRLKQSLSALHVNHGMNPAADNWQAFCQQNSQRQGVELQCFPVTVSGNSGHSLEELARDARYQVFNAHLANGECLVMAHHLDDEMENLLLRLTRGSGPGALAGIPRTRSLGKGRLLRPLLDFQRSSLLQYAELHNLKWVEDDSNADTGFDRNFWRHEVLPLVDKRFPGFRESWRKSMRLCSEADQLQQELAVGDLSSLATDDPRVLSVEPLLAFSEPRQRNVLRYWMLALDFPPPGWQLMRRLTNEVLLSSKSGACLECPAGLVQKYGNQLALLKAGAGFESPNQQQSWKPDSDQVLQLKGNGELNVTFSVTSEPDEKRCRIKATANDLIVRYRQQGERCRLAGRPARSLKKILQDSPLPTWLRSRQPLIYVDSQLVCIPGIGVCDDYVAESDEPGLEIVWQPPDLLYRPG